MHRRRLLGFQQDNLRRSVPVQGFSEAPPRWYPARRRSKDGELAIVTVAKPEHVLAGACTPVARVSEKSDSLWEQGQPQWTLPTEHWHAITRKDADTACAHFERVRRALLLRSELLPTHALREAAARSGGRRKHALRTPSCTGRRRSEPCALGKLVSLQYALARIL